LKQILIAEELRNRRKNEFEIDKKESKYVYMCTHLFHIGICKAEVIFKEVSRYIGTQAARGVFVDTASHAAASVSLRAGGAGQVRGGRDSRRAGDVPRSKQSAVNPVSALRPTERRPR
jgi:hypothetical protein